MKIVYRTRHVSRMLFPSNALIASLKGRQSFHKYILRNYKLLKLQVSRESSFSKRKWLISCPDSLTELRRKDIVLNFLTSEILTACLLFVCNVITRVLVNVHGLHSKVRCSNVNHIAIIML